jgi:hypothetical protein
MRILLLLSLIFMLSACGNLPYKDFDDITKGMDKVDVTDKVGSPLRVMQNKQPHVWIYRFYDEDKNELFREIQFEQGKVVYSGPQITKEKIQNPVGSSYTQKDLEEYLKNKSAAEDVEEEEKPKKAFQDQATMEAETIRDLKAKDKFQEVKPTN